jgi:hypothetical protein
MQMSPQQRHTKWFLMIITALLPIIGGFACTLPRPGVTNPSNQSVSEGGAYPNELTVNYQAHYLAMVIDSYIVNQQTEVARERFKTFSEQDKIEALVIQTVHYAIEGQSREAQLAIELAVYLGLVEEWKPETIKRIVTEASIKYGNQDEVAQQAIDEFASQLNEIVPFQ